MSGLRERKKQAMRELIAEAAAGLFMREGYDAVTVDDVARAANVSRQTVFNYFPTKEQMLFDRDPDVEAALIAAVRDRPPGTSLVSAFRTHTCRFWTRLGAALDHGPPPHGFWEIVRASPALRDYAEASIARHARAVAAQIAAERALPSDDPVCHAIARALCGVNAAILMHGLERLTLGDDPERVVGDALGHADDAYALLERGLADA